MSAAGRARIAAAQRARWAEVKRQKVVSIAMSASPITNRAIRQLSEIRLDELNDCRRLAKMPLLEAGEAWLETRRPFIDSRTVVDYRDYIRKLAKFFGNVPLESLADPDLVRAYQLERSKTCSGAAVNRELSMLQQLWKRIRRWDDVKPFYSLFPCRGNLLAAL